MIYFLQSVDGGPIKIGYSHDVDQRRAALERIYGRPLAVLLTIPGDRDREREIHDQFGHLRIDRTEQFQPGPDLMQFIGRPLFVSANPGMFEAMPTRTALLIQVRGNREWGDWAEKIAKADSRPLSGVVEQALKMYAKHLGIHELPPKR